MADFTQAIQWLKKGKKVRRSYWCDDDYIFSTNEYSTVKDKNNNKTDFNLAWFEAPDWELYEEKDDWNWEYSTAHSLQNAIDVKTLKEKIIEDLISKGYTTNGIFDEDISQILDNRFGF